MSPVFESVASSGKFQDVVFCKVDCDLGKVNVFFFASLTGLIHELRLSGRRKEDGNRNCELNLDWARHFLGDFPVFRFLKRLCFVRAISRLDFKVIFRYMGWRCVWPPIYILLRLTNDRTRLGTT